MEKVVVNKVDNYEYYLTNEKGNQYRLNIEFYSNYKPQVNDIVYIDESILNEVNLYAFDEIYDSKNTNVKDIIKVVSKDNKEYYFQRRFG